MRENLDQVHRWLALSEGGYVNHPDDPGGATNMGVTQRVYSAWLRSKGLPGAKSVRHITEEEARAIFEEQYFVPVWFDRLPSGLDYAMADYSVNSGPARAVRELQAVLIEAGRRIPLDGVMGVLTFSAIEGLEVEFVISRLCHRRLDFMKRLPHWRTFGRGWERRVMGEQPGQQDWDSGVIDRAIRMSRGAPQRTEPRAAPGRAIGEAVGWLRRLLRALLLPGPAPAALCAALALSGGGADAQAYVETGDTLHLRESALGHPAELYYGNDAGQTSLNGTWLLSFRPAPDAPPVRVWVDIEVGDAETVRVRPEGDLFAWPEEAEVLDGEHIVIQIVEGLS